MTENESTTGQAANGKVQMKLTDRYILMKMKKDESDISWWSCDTAAIPLKPMWIAAVSQDHQLI
jgi:hypothetical protein